MAIYLLRHGESEGNVARVNQGRIDLPLTPRGREQAAVAGRWLSKLGVEPEAIYASPLKRAWETAEVIAHEFDATVQHAPDIIEYHAGVAEGLSEEQLSERFPDLTFRSLDERGCWAKFGGESYEQVQERLARFIARVAEEHHAHDIIAIAHGGSLYQLLKLWCGWPAPRHYFTRIGNCTCFKLELREVCGPTGAELQFMVPVELMENS